MSKHHHHHDHIEENETEQPVDEIAAEEEPREDFAEENAPEPANGGEIAVLKEEVEKFKDLYIRSQAEMENLRRRTQIELEKRSKFAVSAFAKDLLTVNDNLSRALDAMTPEMREQQPEVVKNLLVGLDMTRKSLDSALEKNGVTPVDSVGKVFDPNVHKVVQEIEDPEKPAGTIVQEWQKGYMIGGDRVLREAMVVVTRGGPVPGKESEPVHVDTSV